MSEKYEIEKLNSIRIKCVVSSIILIIGIGLVILGRMMEQSEREQSCFLLIMVIAIILIILGVKFNTKYSKEFKKIYKEIFVEGTLKENFNNVYYDPTRGFSEMAVRGFDLNMMGNRFRSEDYIRASFKGINFETSDVYIAQHTSSGKSSHTTVYFEGRMIILDFPEKYVNSVRVYSKAFAYRQGRLSGLVSNKVAMESVDFNKIFDVLTLNDHDAFYLLTPQLMERFQVLQRRYGSIAFHIRGNKLIIAFNEVNNNAFDPKSMWSKIEYEAEKRKVQADIGDIKQILYILGLVA